MNDLALWNEWNAQSAPNYPHEKMIQFVLRSYGASPDRSTIHILDLGCGGGANTAFLAAEGFSAYGCDISPVALERTQARLQRQAVSATLKLGSVHQLPFADECFDAICSIGVLDSAGANLFEQALHECVRTLKPSGCAMLLFASSDDFRPQSVNPMGLHGFTQEQLQVAKQTLLPQLKHFWIDRYTTTYENGRMQQNDFIVTLQKSSHE